MRIFIISSLILSAFIYQAEAAQLPTSSSFDNRIRTIEYNRFDVVKLFVKKNKKLHIEFSPDETIQYLDTGKNEDWDVGPEKDMKNHVFIKPLSDKPSTNMIIVTDKRTYNFDLILINEKTEAKKSNKSDGLILPYFQDVIYTYPEEIKEKSESADTSNELEKYEANPINDNYWMQGSQSISPVSAWDDGRFTFLSFSPGQDLPSFFVENEDGTESRVSRHIDPITKQVVIEQLARKLVLRKGNLVTYVFNKNYQDGGIGSSSGTVSTDIIRVIKKDTAQ